ncbi:MAG: hypothetical protein E7406_01745 [Ruminococcaceae bacterium]|nr:hypothetical protein [Oscillospiraceae bacterium]
MEGNSMELNIQRFAEGGSDGTSSSGNATVAQSQSGVEAEGNSANVPVAGEQKENHSAIDLSAYSEEQLEELIEKNPNLNKTMGKKFSGAFGKRLAEERSKIQEEMKPVNDLIYKLMATHNVNSFEDLAKVLDPSMIETFSIENGTGEKISREIIGVRADNIRKNIEEKAAKKYQDEIERRRFVEQKTREMDEDIKRTKEIYPNFDPNVEIKNPEFGKLLKAGVPVEHAYKVLHMDEIVEAAKKDTAAAYAKSTAQMQARPSENGLGNQVAVNGSMDVSKLTKKERAELAKRAQRGETITF